MRRDHIFVIKGLPLRSRNRGQDEGQDLGLVAHPVVASRRADVRPGAEFRAEQQPAAVFVLICIS